MEYLEQIIQTTIDSFDFSYCVIVNVLTYIIIQYVESYKNKEISTWYKRVITLISICIVGAAYIAFGIDYKLLFNSAILAPVFWSWIGKPIINYLKQKTNGNV